MHKLTTVFDKTIRPSWKLCLSILIIFLFKAWYHEFWFHSSTFTFLQFSSVQSLLCPTLCNPMDCSVPDFPVHHQLPEPVQTHIHQVGDVIQPSNPLSSPSPSCLQSFPASGSFLMSWLFPSGGQSIGASASVLPMNIQGWFPLGLTGLISLLSKVLSRVFSGTSVGKHWFCSALPSLWPNSPIHTWLLKDHSGRYMEFCWKRDVSAF